MTLYLTPAQVAKLLGIDMSKVNRWIHSHELPAFNVAKSARGTKARWRISQADLETFLAGRRNMPATTAPKPTRRRRLPDVPQYV